MQDESQSPEQPKTQKKSISKVTLALSIITGVLVIGCIILGYQLYQTNTKHNSEHNHDSTEDSMQSTNTDNTEVSTAQTIPSYYKPINKEGITVYYPTDWPEPTIKSSSANNFILNIPYGPEVVYQYNPNQKNGEGLWLCTESTSNETVCVPGSATYPPIARRDRTMLQDGTYQYNSIFSSTLGDGSNIVYTFTVANNDKMVTITLPTICQESAEFSCAEGTVKQTDKTAGIVDDIVSYIKQNE
jgi:outer membrane usher protein FimD/PapC